MIGVRTKHHGSFKGECPARAPLWMHEIYWGRVMTAEEMEKELLTVVQSDQPLVEAARG
jgi:hypothetical protein